MLVLNARDWPDNWKHIFGGGLCVCVCVGERGGLTTLLGATTLEPLILSNKYTQKLVRFASISNPKTNDFRASISNP